LHLLEHAFVLLGHLRPGDHVDQDPEEWQDEDQEDTPRLAPSAQVIATEDVSEDRDEHPDEHHPEEEHEHRPEHVAERPFSREHPTPLMPDEGLSPRDPALGSLNATGGARVAESGRRTTTSGTF